MYFKRLLLILLFADNLYATTYYVSPTGDDGDPGTISEPWGTWQKGFTSIHGGDTVFFRDGVWYPSSCAVGSGIIYVNPYDVPARGYDDATNENRAVLMAYPDETPILDCKNVAVPASYLTGIELDRINFWVFKGLTLRNVYQSTESTVHGFLIGGGCSNIIFENVTVKYIGGKGFVDYSSFRNLPYWPEQEDILTDTTRYINCDASYCMDSLGRMEGLTDFGNYSDGFWINVQNSASYVEMRGCRSWMNSDDGFDLPTTGVIHLDHCWTWANGHLSQGPAAGFRHDPAQNIELPWTINNCVSAFNGSGFTLGCVGKVHQAMNFYNNTAYHNGTGAHIRASYEPLQPEYYYNNILYNNSEWDLLITDTTLTHSNNYWGTRIELLGHHFEIPDHSPAVTVTDADFVLVDSTTGVTQMAGARKADWSLPDITFLTLAETSDLIDAGVYVGLDTVGADADLGAFEYGTASEEEPPEASLPNAITLTPTRVSINDAEVSGNANDDGGGTISDKGLCWSIEANPDQTDSHIHGGSGLGEITHRITGLNKSTTYHIRAFATNEIGTTYSADRSFTTPSVSTITNNGSFIRYNGQLIKME